MAVEPRRRCNFRKVGGVYLVTDPAGFPCDRVPFQLRPCPCCGGEPRQSRGIAEIQAAMLLEDHGTACEEDLVACPICRPPEGGFLAWVGAQFYSPQEFVSEAGALGVSKRIAAVPATFKLGESVLYFAHPKAVPPARGGAGQLFGGEGAGKSGKPGIFMACIPTRIEQIVRQSEFDGNTERMDQMRAAGITPVPVPDDDRDHDPRYS